MKNVSQRRKSRFVLGLVSGCVVAGFVACSGSAERRSARHEGAGGDAYEPGAAGMGGRPNEQSAGSSAHAGERSSGGAGAGQAGESSAGAAGDVSNGGASGGDAGGASAGANAGGAGAAGDGGAGGESGVVDPVCGLNMAQVGAYSLWCGKVNMHLDAQNTWTHDTDCSSGCNINGVAYCKKFYPTATAVAAIPQTLTKDWKNAGCDDSTPDGPGISGEAACCAPLP